MGLDISVISEMRPVEIPEGIVKWSDEYYDWESKQGMTLWSPYVHSEFTTQGEGLPDAEVVDSDGETYGFRAGSYTGYNEWRDALAKAAGYEGGSEEVWSKVDGGAEGLPFQELINFADNEGVIGPIASERLYQDFIKYEDQVMHTVDQWYLKMVPGQEWDLPEIKWFKEKYNDWKHSFDIARNNGMVIFH